jgi:hypothetical protein
VDFHTQSSLTGVPWRHDPVRGGVEVCSSWMDNNEWRTLTDSIRDRECLIFLGAGASTVPDGEVGLPTGGILSEFLALECEYPGADKTDFLRVCQYFELVQDGYRLRRAIIRKLSVPGLKPGKLHTLIASLPLKVVLTTNYDRLMETAFQIAGKSPVVAVYDIRNPSTQSIDAASEEKPVVYKLHGTIDDHLSMLCTEDDVVQFLACVTQGDPPLLKSIKQLFENHTILFVGYGLKDWNIRAMIRAMRGSKRQGYVRSFALQRRSTDADWQQSLLYWDKKENVRCLDVDAIEFFEELVRRVRGA